MPSDPNVSMQINGHPSPPPPTSSPIPSPGGEPPANASPPPVPKVTPEPESRLDQLAARFETAHALAKQTKEELEELSAAIKGELSRLHPGEREVILTSPHLANPLQMLAVDQWRIDSKRLKQADPVAWALYAKQITSWRLGALKG